MDPVIVPTLSLAMGACVIEKHICLSRSDPGLDDPIALPPADFEIMVRQLREAACMEPDAIVEMLSDRIGAVTVQAVLGDGVKRLAPSEAANYTRTNRSLHVINAIKAGDKFSTSNIAELRTEKELRPGLDPCFFELILGRVACADIPAGEGLRWEDVGGLSGT
jgi:N-acetylneuraminate synthase